MSAAVAEIRQVNATIPVELQEMICQGKINMPKLFEDVNNFQSNEFVKEEKPKEKPTRFKLVSKIKSFIQDKKTERENKIFDKVRQQMIYNAFGVKSKDLKKYEKDYANQDENKDTTSVGELLRDSRNVYMGQEGSNKRSAKDMLKELVKTFGKIGKLLLPIVIAKYAFVDKIAGKVAAFLGFPGVVAGLAIGGLFVAYKKYKKAKVGNVADAEEKHRSYLEKLNEFMTESTDFLSLVDNEKELVMQKQKELSKKEFKEWCGTYSKQKLKEVESKTSESAVGTEA